MGGRHRHRDHHGPLQPPEAAHRHHESAGSRRGRQDGGRARHRPSAEGVREDFAGRARRRSGAVPAVRDVPCSSHADGGGLSSAEDRKSLLTMRRLLALALVAAASAWGGEFVQAVEFPYYHHPRALWERELVWLKNIGIRTVAFSAGENTPKSDP